MRMEPNTVAARTISDKIPGRDFPPSSLRSTLVIAAFKRPRRLPSGSWRYLVLGLSFLPVLFTAGGCPDLSHAASEGLSQISWFCTLLH